MVLCNETTQLQAKMVQLNYFGQILIRENKKLVLKIQRYLNINSKIRYGCSESSP
jgi:hypothetical protein